MPYVGNSKHSKRIGKCNKITDDLGFWLLSASKTKINKHFYRWNVTKILSHASFKMISTSIFFFLRSSQMQTLFIVVVEKLMTEESIEQTHSFHFGNPEGGYICRYSIFSIIENIRIYLEFSIYSNLYKYILYIF